MELAARRRRVEWALLRISNLPAGTIRDALRWEWALRQIVERPGPLRDWLGRVTHREIPVGGLVLCGPNGTGKTTLAAYLLLRAMREILWGEGRDPGVVEAGGWLERVYIQAQLAELRVAAALCPPAVPSRGWIWYENWPALAERILSLPLYEGAGLSPTRHAAMGALQATAMLVLDDIDSGAETEMREAVLRRMIDWCGTGSGPTVICVANAATGPADLIPVVGDRIADRFGETDRWAVVWWGGDSKRR